MSGLAVPIGRAGVRRLASASSWGAVVCLGTALYAVILSAESIHRHNRFGTGFDTAVYDQRLWLIAHWRSPYSTILDRSFFGNHFEPGIALLTPLYWLGLGVPGLLVVQSIALGLVAPALFALARICGSSQFVASIPALLWLVSPWTASVNLFEFHPEVIVAPLLVVSVVAGLREHWLLLAVTAVLAMAFKEDVSLIYVALGLVLLIRRSHLAGALLALASLAWFVVAAAIVRSHGESYSFFERRFAGSRGDTFGEALTWMLAHPLRTLGDVVSQSGPETCLLLLSAAGLALLAPVWLLLAVPTLGHNALSAYEPQHTLSLHYHLLPATAVFIAAAIGIERAASSSTWGRRPCAGTVGAAALIAVFGGAFIHREASRREAADRTALRSALELIPSNASVAASVRAEPHLSHRVDLFTLPEPFIPIDWGGSSTPAELEAKANHVRFVLLYAGDGPTEYPRDVRAVLPLVRRAGFERIYGSGSVVLLERKS